MPTPRPDNLAVLRGRIAAPNENGCEFWTGAKSVGGYGTVVLDYRSVRVHRLVYELTTGSIPEGHDVHHECGNRLCVAADHLTAIPHRDHALLHRLPDPTKCRRGHPYDDENTYRTKRGLRQCRACNRDSKRRVYALARGLSPDLEVM